ncbi:hypothetical protein [Sinorhizobium meliloti]|uniref:hypothetical protein n=1 Tax=Rhizobium meliloti TaxID=382 RepID=UPI000FD1F049|nr:hypothetical protein [Sinorhizobium meliloti]MDW9668089.1 hypothetical protein [Sinorhizobium meliloti]RVM05386.1 hypothetical protein CN125_24770 [Sinorhizobium meliloti]RVM39205.1 hypothetical protein CN121_33005 [Sinorhizobium meliloti]RVM59872.1 hypothetical protein CN124_26845 [Sinorhizobium meliloti]RVM66101.1 hypothetical protein CN123_18370 [Sinorhizobium meliloti]
MQLDVAAYKYLSEIALYSTIVVALVVTGATVVMSFAFYRTSGGGAATLVRLIERAGVLQMLTVLVIVVGAGILTTIGKISAEGIISILSGIAGYVLGNSQRSRAPAEDRANKEL